MSSQGIRGRRMKNTSGTAAKKKRNAASANGGTSRNPTLIGTNENPHRVTTASVSSRSCGARRFFRTKSGREKTRRSPQFYHATRLQRLAQRERDARRFGRIVQGQRRRAIVEHCIDEMRDFVQERRLEALVERRRAFVANAMRVGNVDPVEPRVCADGEPPGGAENLGRGLVTVRHRARRVEAGELAAVELAGGHAVVDVAEFAQALVNRDRTRGEHAQRPR